LAVAGLAAGAALLGAPERARAGACARPGAVIELVPPASAPIPVGEGVLVRLGTDPSRMVGPAARFSFGGDGHEAFEIEPRLERDGATTIPLTIAPIGPGLARLVPASAPAPGRWRVVGQAGGSAEVTFGRAGPQSPPPAPRLASVERRMQAWGIGGPRRGGTTQTIVARVTGGVRAPAVGVVLYAVTPRGDQPWLTRSLDDHGPDITLYTSGGRCAFEVPGQNPPPPGARVRLAAYDLWGRVGTSSDVVTVGGD
jgi:hypothetical protein